MELRFKTETSAEASHLARELELTLRQHGIPPSALSLKPSSPENMDVGSVLWISLEAANQVLGAAGAIATVAGCIHQIIGKYNTGVVVDHGEGREEISPLKVNRARIEAALAAHPKPKRRSRG